MTFAFASLSSSCLTSGISYFCRAPQEHDLSLKCLNDYGRDKNECTPYFENYKYCRKFWSLVQSERKKEGIKPSLPPPEEREEVRKKYLPHLNNE
ncbi:hypothetical protein BsWGS_03100 [Bradybaena similaris]